MGATTRGGPALAHAAAPAPLDARILRALRSGPAHGYALARDLAAQPGGPDRATVYRRLAALRRAGLVAASPAPGRGAQRCVLRLAPAGHDALRAELGAALGLLMEAYHDHLRAQRPRGGRGRGSAGGRPGIPAGPLVMVSGSRLTGVELGILATCAGALPRRVHLVVQPGAAAPAVPPPGVAVAEGTWAALPFRDGYARTLLVNEAPPARGLAGAAREWARVLHPAGSMGLVARARLPRGADPFVDFLADLHVELFPDTARAAAPGAVTAALRARFGRVEEGREGDQLVWTASSPGARPRRG